MLAVQPCLLLNLLCRYVICDDRVLHVNKASRQLPYMTSQVLNFKGFSTAELAPHHITLVTMTHMGDTTCYIQPPIETKHVSHNLHCVRHWQEMQICMWMC